jgi:drug/metabolite transporter (DMT)-like permease
MISYVAALLAALANATSNVLNRKATQREPPQLEFRPRLIVDLLHRRTWLIAVAVMMASFALGAVALGAGQLAAVQIIIILELPMTLIGAAWFLGARLTRRDWLAIAAMTGGVIGILGCLDPRSGGQKLPAAGYWIAGSAISGGLLAGLYLTARVTRKPARRAALLGMATGLGYGLASAYTKTMTEEFASSGVAAVFSSWPLYAAGVTGAAATWLLQNAYHAGKLAAAQPGITFLDPVQASLWGSSRSASGSAPGCTSASPCCRWRRWPPGCSC